MPRYRAGISPKQKRFAEEYMRNGGNGTQAALKVYDTDDYDTAQVIGSENLAKPMVIQAINGLTSENVEVKHVLQTLANNLQNEEPVIQLKAAELLGKYFKLYTDKIDVNIALEGVKSIGWGKPKEE